MATITPFKIDVSAAQLQDLRDRLARTVMPSEVDGSWSAGPTNAYVKGAIDRLLNGYDWRAQEAAINQLPQFTTEIDGQTIHFIHVKSAEKNAKPLMPGEVMRDEGVVLEKFGKSDFWIGTDVREIPTIENVDVFVERLVRDGIVANNELVASVVEGQPMAMTERTMQRHFLKTTGLTYKHFTLVQRAQQAVALLRMGRSAVDVAFALGFSDQAHMINSLRAIMGQTPGEIARAAVAE